MTNQPAPVEARLVAVWWNDRTVLVFVAVAVVLDRAAVLWRFGFRYVGNDDVIFWQGATDYLHGVFHEPYFYGQAYNFMLEALLAVPLLALGIPHWVALPISTSAITLFPFFYMGTVLFRNGSTRAALVFLIAPLLLPVEYGMLTSMSRGFVQGLFFSAFLAHALAHPSRRSVGWIWSLSTSFAFIFNPNSLLFTLPIGVYLLVLNARHSLFYFGALAGLLPALAVQWVAQSFYVDHPDYAFHPSWTLTFSFTRILEGFTHLDRYFGHVVPVLWMGGWLFLPFMVVMALWMLRSNKAGATGLLVAATLIVLCFGEKKVNDDLGTILLSSQRMFLAVPLLLCLALSWALPKEHLDKRWRVVVLALCLAAPLVKVGLFHSALRRAWSTQNYGPVAVKSIEELARDCRTITRVLSVHDVDLVVFVAYDDANPAELQFFSCGCPSMEHWKTPTVMSTYERRTWVFESEKTSIRREILVFGRSAEPDTSNDMESVERLSPPMTLIHGNRQPTAELLGALGMKYLRKDPGE